MTLRSLSSIKRVEMRFDSNYDHLHFIPMDSFGMRLVNILTLPDWRENLLSLLFDEDDCANGNSKDDAKERLSHVDFDNPAEELGYWDFLGM